MNTFKIYLLTICQILLFSCTNKKQVKTVDYSQPTEIVLDETEAKDSVKLTDIVEDYRFIPLETSEASLIGGVNKVRFYDGKIFVLDMMKSRSLFVFSDKGEFLYKIGRQGKGPGEFLLPMNFTFDKKKKEVIVVDGQRKQLLFYTVKGDFKRNLRLDYFVVGATVINNEMLALIASGFDDYLILSDTLGVKKKSFFPFKETGRRVMQDNPFQTFNDSIQLFRVFKVDTTYTYKRDTIYKLNKISISAYRKISYTEKGSSVIDYHETGDQILLSIYNVRDKHYQVLISKQTGNKIYLKRGKLINDIYYYNRGFYAKATTDNNEFVASINPAGLLNAMEKLPEGTKIESKMRDLVAEIDENSNPVLMVAKLKEF